MRLLHLTHAKPRKDYEVGFILVAVRVFVPPTRPGKNCPVESGDAYMYATVVPYPVFSYPSHTIDPRESRREGRKGGERKGDVSRSTLTGQRLDDKTEHDVV